MEPPGGATVETPVEALARRVVDLGYQPLWAAVAGPGAAAEAVRSAVVSNEMARNELRRLLDLARWWPPGGTQEPTAQRAGSPAREVVST
jgi:hypothetical protein